MPLLQKYKLNITWGDQDLLNIIFHHNPGKCLYGIYLYMHEHRMLFSPPRDSEVGLIVIDVP